MAGILTVNLETGMPTVETAKSRMSAALRTAKAQRMTVLKLIHGYGSTGKGGRIRTGVRRELAALKQSGKIKEFVPGEEFSPFDERARRALVACPQLSRDRDYTRCNQGITVVIL